MRAWWIAVAVGVVAAGAPASADGPEPGSCTTWACVESISASGTCRRAEDGSRQGFFHPAGEARVTGRIAVAGVQAPWTTPFTYDYFLGDTIGSSWQAWNWPGPIDHAWRSVDSQQGWLVPTDAQFRVTYRVDAWIHVTDPANPLGWAHARSATAIVPCV